MNSADQTPASFPATTRHRLLLWVAPVIVIGGCLTLWFSWGRSGEPEGKHEAATGSVADPPMVKLLQTPVKTIVRTVSQPSFVEAYERTSIYPKMTAYIEKWCVDIGDKVKKNDVLAKLFVPEWVEDWETKKATVKLDEERVQLARKLVKVAEADVKAAEARLLETKAILDQYEAQVVRWDSEVKRLRREVANGTVDPQVLLESENQLRSNRAAREAAKATILKADAELLSKNAKLDEKTVAVAVASAELKVAESEAKRLEALVGYLTLPAPFDGIITVRNANTNDFVLPANGDPTAMHRSPHQSPSGAAPLYVVDRTDIVRIFVDIPEQDANYVRKGTPASVYIRGYKDEWLSATVTRTSWALNVTSRTLRAEIDLNNPNSKILPGMYAYANVIIEHPDVRALPVSATFTVGEQTFCWLYKNGHVVRTEIQTGISDGKWIEVTNRRLPNGPDGKARWVPFDDRVNVATADDLMALTDGAPVRLAPGVLVPKMNDR